MHTRTSRGTTGDTGKIQLKLYKKHAVGQLKRGFLNNYTSWQKIYYICSTLPDPGTEYFKQKTQVKFNKELIKQKNSYINKYNYKYFTPAHFLFKLKNLIEINLNGLPERKLYYGDKIYLQTCRIIDKNTPLQKFKIPTLIKTDNGELYVYGQNSKGKANCTCIDTISKELEELKGKFNQGKEYIHEHSVSVHTWKALWDKLTSCHVPYQQEYNSGRSYLNIAHQTQMAKLLDMDINDISIGTYDLQISAVKGIDQEGCLVKRDNFKLLDAILRNKEIQNGSLGLFDEKDETNSINTNSILLEKTFKQITMCGGFAAYTMEELYFWSKHLDNVTQKLARSLMGGKGEPHREIWRKILKEHKKCNYLEVYDQIIATLDKMKKQIEFAMYLSRQEHEENLTDRYPVIVTLFKKLYAKKILSKKQFEQILEKARDSLNTEFTGLYSENERESVKKKVPQLSAQIALLRKIFCGQEKSEDWKEFKQNLTQIFTGEKNHEDERKTMCSRIASKSEELFQAEKERDDIKQEIKKYNIELNQCEINLSEYREKLRDVVFEKHKKILSQQPNATDSQLYGFRSSAEKAWDLKIKEEEKRLVSLDKQIVEYEAKLLKLQNKIQKLQKEVVYYCAFGEWLKSPYNNKKLFENISSEGYGESVHYDFLGLLKPGSQSQLNKITWRDYFYENIDGYDKGSEFLNAICKQTGKVENITNMLEPIVDDCYTVDSLQGCFSYFIRYFIEYNRNHLYSLRNFDRHMGSFLNVFDKKEEKTGVFTSYMRLEYKNEYKDADILVLLSGLHDAAIKMPKTVLGSYDNLAHRVLAIVTLFYKRLNKLITNDKARMNQLLSNMQGRTKRLISVSKKLNVQIKVLSDFEETEMLKLKNLNKSIQSLIGEHNKNSGEFEKVFNQWLELDNDISSQKKKMSELSNVLQTNHRGISELYNQIENFTQDYTEREKQFFKIALKTWNYLKERIEKLHKEIDGNKEELGKFQQDFKTPARLSSLGQEYQGLLQRQEDIKKQYSIIGANITRNDEMDRKITDLQREDKSLQEDIEELSAKIKEHEIEKVPFKIETLQNELSQVQNLCDQLKVICENRTLKEDVEKRFNKLKQNGLELKLSFEKTQEKINETEQNVVNLETKVNDLKGSLEKVDAGNSIMSEKLKSLESDAHKLEKYKLQKQKLIKNIIETGEKIKGYAQQLDNDVEAAQSLNKDIGFDLGALDEKDQNKVLAVLEVIKNYLSLPLGKKSPYFRVFSRKSARQKAKELSRKLKTYMESYSKPTERNLAWDDVEKEMKRHRHFISGFFAKIFKIETKSQKIYEQKLCKLQNCTNISEKQNIGKIYEQNVELLKTFVKQEAVSRNGLNEIEKYETKIDSLFSRINNVKNVIGSLHGSVKEYVAFVEGQKDVIQKLIEPQSVVEYLEKSFEDLCKMFNFQVPVVLLGTELNKRKNMMNKHCGNKQQVVEYAKKWLPDIQKFLNKQKEKLNSYEKKLEQAKNQSKMFENKVKNDKSGKSFFDEGLKLQCKLHKVVENYNERMNRTEKIFSLACNLYRGQLDETQNFMTLAGKGNHEHHKQTRKNLQEVNEQRLHLSAKQLSKMGINAPHEQVGKLKELLKEQEKEDRSRVFNWINNCFRRIEAPTMLGK